jgi:acyl-CoA thioester hydrolase
VSEPRRNDLGHYPVKVRFSDVDVYGHVNNVKYFEYFQEGRVAMMRHLRDHAIVEEQMHVVVAQADMAFRAPMVMRPEPYDLDIWVARVGTKSVVYDGEITDTVRDENGVERRVVLARNRVVLVFFDLAGGRSVSPPETVRAALESLATPTA